VPAAKPAKPAKPALSIKTVDGHTTLSPFAGMVDELGQLKKEYALALAPLEMKLPRIKALETALQASCIAKADSEWIVEGARFGVRLGPCALKRSIDFKALVKKIGTAVYATFATCTLGDLNEHVSDDVMDAVVTSDLTGPRKLTTYEKGTA
jgi:hypothetical protein